MKEEGLRIRWTQPLFFVGSAHSMLKSPPLRAGSVFGSFWGSLWKPFETVSGPVSGSVWKPLRTQFAYFRIFKVKLRKPTMKIGGGPLLDFFAFGPPSVHVL